MTLTLSGARMRVIDEPVVEDEKLRLKERLQDCWDWIKYRFAKLEPCEHGVCHETCNLCFGGTMRADITEVEE